jgi:hypothetical protein
MDLPLQWRRRSRSTFLTAFQTAENLIALFVKGASRIANPVAHS